jgi:hypothetical protein
LTRFLAPFPRNFTYKYPITPSLVAPSRNPNSRRQAAPISRRGAAIGARFRSQSGVSVRPRASPSPLSSSPTCTAPLTLSPSPAEPQGPPNCSPEPSRHRRLHPSIAAKPGREKTSRGDHRDHREELIVVFYFAETGDRRSTTAVDVRAPSPPPADFLR